MSIIAIFSAAFCNEQQVIQNIIDRGDYLLLTDRQVIEKAACMSGLPARKLKQAFSWNGSGQDGLACEKATSAAWLRLAVSKFLTQGPIVLSGFTSLLIFPGIDDALKVCLVAGTAYRQQVAITDLNLTEEKALKQILEDQKIKSSWTGHLYGVFDPWQPSLYDIVLPMDKTPAGQAAQIIFNALKCMPEITSEKSNAVARDFELSSLVQVKLAQAGHDVRISAQSGIVDIYVQNPVLMQTRLEDELQSIANQVPGVINTRINFQPAADNIPFSAGKPQAAFSKILLVDDEREFVQTLSERLQMRQMDSTAVFDGETALDCVEKDEPEVMIIDLKMPGIDGIEVLRRVKQSRPGIEVIVLTGHGSEQDRQTCMSLGAFAYMQKPVDIDLLSKTLKAANEKINCHR